MRPFTEAPDLPRGTGVGGASRHRRPRPGSLGHKQLLRDQRTEERAPSSPRTPTLA
jgi:hypothetical protein